jgi:3-phenylpropionate/cinnamic acid dioxygenase small subunit
VPYFKLDVEYTDSEVELNYARWNSRTNGYDSYTQTTVYELNDSNAALMLASTK